MFRMMALLLLYSLVLSCSSKSNSAKNEDNTRAEQNGGQNSFDENLIPFLQPVKDSKTGFLVGGKNKTSLIRGLTEINNVPIDLLEANMRPGARMKDPLKAEAYLDGSSKGFLGPNEKLLEILAEDNEYVVEKMGLSHQRLARLLKIAASFGSYDNQFNQFSKDKDEFFSYRDNHYKIRIKSWKGDQFSPFLDGTLTYSDAELENLTLKKTLRYSLLLPFMIERYGFYEGKGTAYRVEPKDIIELFPFLEKVGKSANNN